MPRMSEAEKAKKDKAREKARAARDQSTLPAGCEALLGKQPICTAIGVSLRMLQGMLSSGEYPKEDFRVGVLLRWKVSTHNAWIEARCAGAANNRV
jgi:hypothetical protein